MVHQCVYLQKRWLCRRKSDAHLTDGLGTRITTEKCEFHQNPGHFIANHWFNVQIIKTIDCDTPMTFFFFCHFIVISPFTTGVPHIIWKQRTLSQASNDLISFTWMKLACANEFSGFSEINSPFDKTLYCITWLIYTTYLHGFQHRNWFIVRYTRIMSDKIGEHWRNAKNFE